MIARACLCDPAISAPRAIKARRRQCRLCASACVHSCVSTCTRDNVLLLTTAQRLPRAVVVPSHVLDCRLVGAAFLMRTCTQGRCGAVQVEPRRHSSCVFNYNFPRGEPPQLRRDRPSSAVVAASASAAPSSQQQSPQQSPPQYIITTATTSAVAAAVAALIVAVQPRSH